MIAALIIGITATTFFLTDPFLMNFQHGLMVTAVSLGLIFSAVINLCFFFIRRWDGCIEKLGGLTFTALLWLSAVTPLLTFRWIFLPEQQALIGTLMAIMSSQVPVIGFITTYFQRSKNFSPPKPGHPWKW